MFNKIRAQERYPTVKSVRAYVKRLRRTHVRIHELVPCAFIGACNLAKRIPGIMYANRDEVRMTNLMCDANNRLYIRFAANEVKRPSQKYKSPTYSAEQISADS